MIISRLITGILFIVLGILLFIFSFFESYFLLIYAIPLLGLGFWTLFNESEDKIEQRKDIKGKKSKK